MKIDMTWQKLEAQNAALLERLKPLQEQVIALGKQREEIRKQAWMAQDVDFVNTIKAAMLIGPVICKARAYTALAISSMNPDDDIDVPEMVGVIKQVKATGTKHIGVWAWFAKRSSDEHNTRGWTWIPATMFRSNMRYDIFDKNCQQLTYPELPKWVRAVR